MGGLQVMAARIKAKRLATKAEDPEQENDSPPLLDSTGGNLLGDPAVGLVDPVAERVLGLPPQSLDALVREVA